MRAARRSAGLTLVELIVIVCVIGVLAAVLLERVLLYQEIAEKTGMERTVAVMRSAMALKAGGMMLSGRFQEIAQLRDANPMLWLSDRPFNYVGELFDPPPGDVPPGSWYYDRSTRELAYRPRMTRFLDPASDGRLEVRFRAVAELAGLSGPGGERSEVQELSVKPSRPYRWTPTP